MLADSATELFAARSMLYEVARSIDAGPDRKILHGQASMAKLYCSEMAGRVADRAVQVFGGRGYMRENVAERMYRELRVERIWEGASEIQRLIVARQMMNRGPVGGARGSVSLGGRADGPKGRSRIPRAFRTRRCRRRSPVAALPKLPPSAVRPTTSAARRRRAAPRAPRSSGTARNLSPQTPGSSTTGS